VLLPDLRPAHADPHALRQRQWLYEISHTNPLWVHPRRAACGRTGDLLKIPPAIGWFVTSVVTRVDPAGIVACSTTGAGACRVTGGERGRPRSSDSKNEGPARAHAPGARRAPWRARIPDSQRVVEDARASTRT